MRVKKDFSPCKTTPCSLQYASTPGLADRTKPKRYSTGADQKKSMLKKKLTAETIPKYE